MTTEEIIKKISSDLLEIDINNGMAPITLDAMASDLKKVSALIYTIQQTDV